MMIFLVCQAVKNKLTMCQQRIKAQKEKEKKTFANMFDKFAMADKKKEALDKQVIEHHALVNVLPM